MGGLKSVQSIAAALESGVEVVALGRQRRRKACHGSHTNAAPHNTDCGRPILHPVRLGEGVAQRTDEGHPVSGGQGTKLCRPLPLQENQEGHLPGSSGHLLCPVHADGTGQQHLGGLPPQHEELAGLHLMGPSIGETTCRMIFQPHLVDAGLDFTGTDGTGRSENGFRRRTGHGDSLQMCIILKTSPSPKQQRRRWHQGQGLLLMLAADGQHPAAPPWK